jgi:hypothetical protein
VVIADMRAANRDAGGTAWQPDATPHGGVHLMSGDWMVMLHGEFNLVASDQSGPRGDSRTFTAGMLMAMAERDLGPGTLKLRAMVAPDPLMGPEGYPLLLATGETADGVTHLVDRQHPHDLFMELSVSYSLPVGDRGSVYVYGGLPGEPAFGPPAFMHRTAAMDSPEAPISHHWFDSTHVTFGVVTGGFTWDRWKVEASAFRGREPDQNRWDIETGELDSRAARISFNPTANWSLQASWADITSPEALEPLVDEQRVSLSALYGRAFGQQRLRFGHRRLGPQGQGRRHARRLAVRRALIQVNDALDGVHPRRAGRPARARPGQHLHRAQGLARRDPRLAAER